MVPSLLHSESPLPPPTGLMHRAASASSSTKASDRVLAVTCHHILFETTKTHNVKYELKGASAPPKYVRLHSICQFQRFLDDIKHRINRHAIMVNLHEREIRKLEAKEKSQDPEEAEE